VSALNIFDNGYTDLVCVIPPGASLTAGSSIKPAMLGKVPGLPRPHNLWSGYDFICTPIPNRSTVDHWAQRGANLGLLAARFPGVDIDCDDPGVAEVVAELARTHLGWAPARIRQGSPRRLLVYRTDRPFPKQRVTFLVGGQKQAIDILGAGQQYLIEGVHPAGARYLWEPDGLDFIRPPALTDFEPEALERFLRDVQAHYPDGFNRSGLGERSNTPAQEFLAADGEDVARLVATLPNTAEDRESYIRMGTAIKAAAGAEGLAIWQEWCDRWDAGQNDPDTVTADWKRIKPPYTIGIEWLRDQAKAIGQVPPATEFTVSTAPAPSPVTVDIDRKGKSGAVVNSDAWLATRLIDDYGEKIRYCGMLGGWLVWDGHCWAQDELSRVEAWTGKVCRAAGREAATSDAKGAAIEAKRLCSIRVVRDVIGYAKSDPRIVLPVTAFDLDPWLLNTPGGIVDLRTGEQAANDSSRLMTKCTLVAPDATVVPTEWLRFLNEATRGDKLLLAYLQRLAGYSLTGSTREHVMAFLHGSGGNGKGTFLNTLVKVMGTYAKVASMDTFTASKFDRHPADLATLVGARLVTAQETQEGRAWDETKVKSITGGDPITARLMRENPFTFVPQFTLAFAGNHRPHFSTVDDAMRRRLHLVPFTVKPATVDRLLDDKLKPELPGILAWAIAGALAWQTQGLNPPPVVTLATQDYFLSEDPFGRWMKEHADLDAVTGEEIGPLFTSWRAWCGEHEEHPGTEKLFTARLRSMGLSPWRHPESRRMVFGLRLRSSAAAEQIAMFTMTSSLLD